MDGQNGMTRAIVAVELLCSEKITDFRDGSQPTCAQVAFHRLSTIFLSISDILLVSVPASVF